MTSSLALILEKILRHNYRWLSKRSLSSAVLSKSYICDSSVIDAYYTNSQLKAIIDRQDYNYFYEGHRTEIPTVFKSLPSDVISVKNQFYLSKLVKRDYIFFHTFEIFQFMINLVRKHRLTNHLKMVKVSQSMNLLMLTILMKQASVLCRIFSELKL